MFAISRRTESRKVRTSAVMNASFAPLLSPRPRRIAITVEPPIANKVDIATSVVINGTVILTAARASALTPLPTKIPSTILYK